ncbi:hypothetical protein ACFXG4_47510 [Nocardia sp. NPDC059246]|uniref:hypothetical protein n=1 Tax=unclassified Nocardia TaxID=2637762 RepID=UPI0036B25C2C
MTSAPYQKLQSEPLNKHEQELLLFAARWAPYGGGEEFILPQFGISPSLFYRRVLAALRPVRDHRLTPEMQQQLTEFCTKKIEKLT